MEGIWIILMVFSISECKKANMNVVFLVDGSASMSTDDFEKNKQFIWDIMTELKNTSIQFSAVQFSRISSTIFTFNDYLNGTAKEKLDKEIFMKSLTNTHQAIRFVLNNHFNNVMSGADPEAIKALLIITDGDPTDTRGTELEECDRQNIKRFVIGVGTKVSLTNLVELASEPKNSNTFMIQDYAGLNSLLDKLRKISNIEVCKKANMNVVFLVDGSASMVTDDFEKNKQFIWDIMTELKNPCIQFSAVQFSRISSTIFTFSDYLNGTAKEKLDKEILMKSLTNTHQAIRFVLNNHFNNVMSGADPEAVKALVIVTDGDPTDTRGTELEECDRQNIKRFVIGFGTKVSLTNLVELASEPKNSNTFMIQDYAGLNSLLDKLQNKISNIEGKTTVA